jgi:UDP-glucose 4-epimerase
MGELRNGKTITALFERYGFDGVVHCGGISGPMVAPDRPLDVCAINITATVQLMETARRHGVKRFVHCSSIAAYGAPKGAEPLTESAGFRPVDIYGATKAAGDALIHAYRAEHGLDGIALRIARVYGPGRTTRSFVKTLIEDAMNGQASRPPGDGTDRYQYVYRDDIVAALALALDVPRPPQTAYNIGNKETTSDAAIAEIVCDLIPDADIAFEASDRAVGLARQPMDVDAARCDLGFIPATDMRTGIAAYIGWMRKRRKD